MIGKYRFADKYRRRECIKMVGALNSAEAIVAAV
jgi:hypothetical protein